MGRYKDSDFIEIAVETDKKGDKKLAAVFMGVLAQICVSDEDILMKGSSAYRHDAILQTQAYINKTQAFRAFNAFVKAQGEIKSGQKTLDDFPAVEKNHPNVWYFGRKP